MKDLLYGFGQADADAREIIADTRADQERQLFACYLNFLAAVYYPKVQDSRTKAARRRRRQQKQRAAIGRAAGLKFPVGHPHPA